MHNSVGRPASEKAELIEAIMEAQALALDGRKISEMDSNSSSKYLFERIFEILRVANSFLNEGAKAVSDKEIWDMIDLKQGVVTVLLLLALCTPAVASTPEYFNKVVDAIYLAEGGKAAKKPFGILSVPCDGYTDCRKIAYNTVRNNWYRWEAKGRPGEYLAFLASKYAPVGVSNDPTNLNQNWLRNVRGLIK